MSQSANTATTSISPSSGRRKIALALWGGYVGGAETLSASLAEHMHKLGAAVTVVFVQEPWPLSKRLDSIGIPYRSCGFRRGRDIIGHPFRYASEIASAGPDGALLLECGFIGGALRLGGYRRPIVAVEHGALIGLQRFSRARRLLWKLDRTIGAWADDVEVGVSNFMLDRMHEHSHATRTTRIYNGIDPHLYLPLPCDPRHEREPVVGFAGRLIPGKGVEHLIHAVARVNEHTALRLLIAGDGPERTRFEDLSRDLGVTSQIRFAGVIDDPAAFWHMCDIGAVPSDAFTESFSMVTLEIMTSGRALVASRNGAIPELVVDGVTGTLVCKGDVDQLADALINYARDPNLRRAHGAAARNRAVERFHIETCARSYLELFDELATQPRRAYDRRYRQGSVRSYGRIHGDRTTPPSEVHG